MSLILKDGKFYKDGIAVPTEIGNKEQIELLKNMEQKINALKDGTELDYDTEAIYTYSAMVKCLCGESKVYFKNESDEDNEPNCLSGQIKSCHNCKRQYETYMDGSEIMVKLKS